MKLKAILLAGLVGLPLFAGTALAADSGTLSLVDAARLGNRDAVASLLNSGANPDIAEADDTSALMWAANRNDLQMADLLLKARTDVNAANEYGATALYIAAAMADADMVGKFLGAGANANTHLSSGETPLMEAARQGKLAVVQLLLSAGADPNAREANGGQNALMWAISERHSLVADELVRRGADVQARSSSGFTALMFAAQQGDTESARILLDAGARPNDVTPKTRLTPLIVASAMGGGEIAEMLLAKGADVDAADATGFTSLHHAMRNRNSVAIVRTLLGHRANPNVRLHQERPTAAASGIFLEGATPLALAAEINNLDAIKALVAAGADPLIGTERNTTPLILAAGGGTDLARPRSAEERATALETVKFLVERGADVNAAGQFGWTALHAASYQGLNDVIEFLAGKGAQLDAKDSFGQTALSIAYAIITKDIGDAYYQTPRVFRRDTADRLLALGATPLEKSGVIAAVERKE